jgi:thiol-disulfide isomerase/thioredoxin
MRSNSIILAIASFAVLLSLEAAETPPPHPNEPVSGNVPEPVKVLRRKADAVDAALAAVRKASDESRAKLSKAYVELYSSVIPQILDGIGGSPEAPSAVDLLSWIITSNHPPSAGSSYRKAIDFLRDHYTAHPDIGPICRYLSFQGDPTDQATLDFLRTASASNPNRAARAYATYALASLLKEQSEEIAFLQAVPTEVLASGPIMNKEALAYLEMEERRYGAGEILQQAEDLYRTLKDQYQDCPNFTAGPGLRNPKATIGIQAAEELGECEHLSVGKPAPNIEGEDLDGQKLDLKTYRGKVTLLTFWETGCGPCMGLLHYERTLQDRLKEKPLALLGVNPDETRELAKQTLAKEAVTLRSFWNGGNTWGGITEEWNVHGWPTLYILDAKGVIRFKDEGYGDTTPLYLDAVVDRLIKEAESQP